MLLNEVNPQYPTLDAVILVHADKQTYQLLEEGKQLAGRFPQSLRIDQPTHLQGDGQQHAHVFGRRGNELGVVNFDGTGSHSSKFKLHDKDADKLRALGFKIRADNLVEWTLYGDARQLLLS